MGGENQASGLLKKARRYSRDRNWSAAAEAYEQLLEAQPDNGRAWIQYGHALKEQSKKPEAATAYRQAVSRLPHLADGHFQLGILQSDLGHLDEASSSLLTALALGPQLEVARERLVAHGYDESSLESSLFVKLLELGPPVATRESFFTRVRHGRCIAKARQAMRKGNPAKAIELYRQAEILVPGRSVVLTQLAHALKDTGSPAEAAVNYRRAIAANPTLAETHFHLAHVNREIGLRAAAARNFLICWKLRPGQQIVSEALQAEGFDWADLHGLALETWGASAPVRHHVRLASSVPARRIAPPAKPAYLAPAAQAIWSALSGSS